MRLIKISIKNFRNIVDEVLEFSPETTLILGNNAEGKTNVIEAIYAFAHSRSFRRARERELIRFGCEEAVVSSVFEEKGREVKFDIVFSKKNGKSFFYNGIKLDKMRDFFGHFQAVLFVPEYLKIIKNGPGERRSFIDSSLCQIKPQYISTLFVYHRLSEEKNAALKSYKGSETEKLLIDVYNERLAKTAAVISRERREYLEKIKESARRHFSEMSGGDRLDFEFLPSGLSEKCEDLEDFYKKLFEKSFENDVRISRMSTGAQLDDVEILINGVSARSYASQGQQRSAVIALKLAEGEAVESVTRSSPIYLFDDILSELDERRREYILKNLNSKQVVITSCMEHEKVGVVTYRAEKGKYTRI